MIRWVLIAMAVAPVVACQQQALSDADWARRIAANAQASSPAFVSPPADPTPSFAPQPAAEPMTVIDPPRPVPAATVARAAGPYPVAAPSAPDADRGASNKAAALIRLGNGLLTFGDVASARRAYHEAAREGSARAATAEAETYDPAFLRNGGAAPDAAMALALYKKGMDMGDPEAAVLFRRLSQN